MSGLTEMSKMGVLPVRNMRESRMFRVCATANVEVELLCMMFYGCTVATWSMNST